MGQRGDPLKGKKAEKSVCWLAEGQMERVVKELPSDIWHHLLLSSLNQKRRGREASSRLQRMSLCVLHMCFILFVIYLFE